MLREFEDNTDDESLTKSDCQRGGAALMGWIMREGDRGERWRRVV
jgi:hypothetical protein